ncbi:hypothetical protein HU200_047374 [Digitaria exilis]|uniref:Uncharacterized protein n=1 Tax=Digitaria exilis TaxID=1010633 RepID=A0A835AUN0_9POAL|nr:hypothetical protein HU200_047374 [Digitaria exilis]
MYPGVPLPHVSTLVRSCAMDMDTPKSDTWARNPPSRRMLAGLMSRWRICRRHSWWRYASALATSPAMRRRAGHVSSRRRSSPPLNSHQSSDPFSKNGYTRYCPPPWPGPPCRRQ